jgi:hypothetical protein
VSHEPGFLVHKVFLNAPLTFYSLLLNLKAIGNRLPTLKGGYAFYGSNIIKTLPQDESAFPCHEIIPHFFCHMASKILNELFGESKKY